MSRRDPVIIAHRAGPLRHGLQWHAEQTLPAFAATWARDRVMCELDVRFTADGQPVVFHDVTLTRIAGRRGRLDELTLREFRALRADVHGTAVPLATLDEVLRFASRTGAHLDVELKNLPGEPQFDATSRTAETLAGRLRAAGVPAHRLIVQSFWPEDVATLRSVLPGARTSLLVHADANADDGVETASAISADAVGLRWPVDAAAIRSARDRGLAVMAYTVNDPEAVRAAADAGVDAVITDDPAAARHALAAPVALAA